MAEAPNITKGSLYGLSAFFCMAVFGTLTKLALLQSSVRWVSFIAYLTGTLALMPYIAKQGVGYLKSKHYPYLVGRAVIGTLASFLYTLSIHYIPIVNGTLLFNTAPLFIPLITLLFLKSKVTWIVWMSVLIGFSGVIIIIKPTSEIFTQLGNLIGLLSGISLAIAYLLMNALTATDFGIRIIFYYLGLGALIQIPLLFSAGSFPSGEGCIYAALGGLALLTAQILLVRGYKYAEAPQIGVYQYSSVVFVALIDWLIWGRVPGRWELIGMALVMLAGIVIIRSNHRKSV